jgi:hypothetical protein
VKENEKKGLEGLIDQEVLVKLEIASHPVRAEIEGVEGGGLWLKGEDVMKEMKRHSGLKGDLVEQPGQEFTRNYSAIFIPYQHIE